MRSLQEIRKQENVGGRTWSTPLFEDTTVASAALKGLEAWDTVTRCREALNHALEVVELWDKLHQELILNKTEKVSQLPANRIKYWKSKFEYTIVPLVANYGAIMKRSKNDNS